MESSVNIVFSINDFSCENTTIWHYQAQTATKMCQCEISVWLLRTKLIQKHEQIGTLVRRRQSFTPQVVKYTLNYDKKIYWRGGEVVTFDYNNNNSNNNNNRPINVAFCGSSNVEVQLRARAVSRPWRERRLPRAPYFRERKIESI